MRTKKKRIILIIHICNNVAGRTHKFENKEHFHYLNNPVRGVITSSRQQESLARLFNTRQRNQNRMKKHLQ